MAIGRVRTKRKAPAKLAQGSQPVPTVSSRPPVAPTTTTVRTAELATAGADDDDTQVVDEAELAALHAEKHTTREG